MSEFEPGDVVLVPHPDTGAEIEGTFLAMDDADTAWVELDDGTTRKIAREDIRAV